jgi:5-methylcytosine-specific restriction endonuclease McrA
MIWDIPAHHRRAAERDILFDTQGGKCKSCGQEVSLRNVIVDHITPRTSGGSESITNLQLLCEDCAGRKRDSEA